MPSRYFGTGGGLQINPVLVNQAPDPLEQAIKQAQLYNLQQDPKFRERALTLQQLGMEHSQANDEAMRRLQEAGLLETVRHNTAGEKLDTNRLAEATRSNVVSEGLAARGQDVTMRGQDLDVSTRNDTNKTQITTALIHTLLANYSNPDEKSVAAETLSKLGYPELKQSLSAQGPSKDQQMATAALELLKKKRSGETATTPFVETPNQSREYNRPKFNLLDYFRKK